jgi:hypothetical protein
LPYIEGPLDETSHAVERHENDASDEAVGGFEPLAVRLVGVARVVSIVACSLGLRAVAVELDLF